jgi:peptide/nickel transport system permease protein
VGFLLRKIAHLIVVMFAVSAITFAMVDFLPGDISYVIAGAEASKEDLEAIRSELVLDRNVVVRYISWLGRAARGDLGQSLMTYEPVSEALTASLPVTLELLFLAQFTALVLAIPLALLCARRAGGILDKLVTTIGFGFISIPSFVMAILLIFLFAVRLKWFPAASFTPLSQGLLANLKSIALPSLSIALVEWVILVRVLRSDLITTLAEDFILMARSKGLSELEVLLKHALRPSSLTLVTVVGLQVGHLISGSLIVETIFALPGIGRLLIHSIFSRDIFVVQGCILWITLGYVLINFMVDILYRLLDPRIRLGKSDG